MTTNAFGMRLAWLWAIDGLKGPKDNVLLYAAKHAMPDGKSHLDDILGVVPHGNVHGREFLVDVLIERYSAKFRTTRPLLACEIEAHTQHAVDFVCEGIGASDYLRDFMKLLYVRAPKRLFVASCVASRLEKLSETLSRGWRELRAIQADDQMSVVLLPARATQRDRVLVGRLDNAGRSLVFTSLASGPLEQQPANLDRQR